MIKSTKELNTKLPILPIGAVATTLNIHQRTLRIYDKEGILSPKRSTKNRRNYTLDDIEKAKLILFLTRNLALNLAGVKIILTMLEENNVDPQDYLEYVNNIALKAKIDTKKQEDNIEKCAKKGRRIKEQ